MKIAGKTEDRAIDNLLRVQAVLVNSTGVDCEGFDADLANAYIENSLTTKQQQRYENHIAACVQCRKLTVSLMRAAQADVASIRPATFASVEKSSSNWITSLRSLIPAFVTPRFALAATAIIAVAIALPLFISNRKYSEGSNVASSSPAQSQIDATASSPEKDGGLTSRYIAATPNSEDRARAKSGATANKDTESLPESEAKDGAKPDEALLALNKERESEQTAPAPPPAAADTTAKKEVETSPTPKSEEARGDDRAQSRASETPAGSEEKSLPRIDPNEARSLPDGSRGSQPKVVPLAPGRSGVEVPGDKNKPVIRPDRDSSPRTESHSESFRANRIAEGPASSSKSESGGGVKPPTRSTREMKVGGKKFFLLDGIWTQEDYRKDKELPVVPVEQGSELYNDLMSKHSKLKLYFTGLADQSAIIVYKGTVYKLTPKK